MAKEYAAKDIQVLEGLDAVRMRPGMYIGTTGSRGLHHLLWELVDNAMDEAMGGHATQVRVELRKDGSASVEDNGRGMPVDPHPQLGVSGVEVIFTRLHAGGKFNNKNYAYSGGLHGVGASVVNALSRWLVVDSYVDWAHWRMSFRSEYDPREKKVLAGVPDGPLVKVGNTRKRGTRVTFLPDDTVFEDVSFNGETVAHRLRELAYLNRGVKITFWDERIQDSEKRERVFCYEGGIADYVLYLNHDKTPLNEKPVYLEGSRDDVMVRAALQYTDSYTESFFSYVNNIPTHEGGTHEIGFKAAYTKVFNVYARRVGALKEKDANLTGEDFREGLTCVLSCMVRTPQFEGQTKGRLGNSEVRPAVEAVVAELLGAYLEDLRHQAFALGVIEKAAKSAKVREAARRAKENARQKNQLEAAPLVGKLSSCTGRKASENELFIVEGDSAGGSAKQGRDRRFQAILPLRGKPLNVEKKRLDQVLGNEEFRSIITALGCGIEEDFALADLKYNRVIILSDADQDGAHIRAILLTFFYRYMRGLITDGHVYIGLPPLYQVRRGGEARYAYDDAELRRLTRGLRSYTVQRYKGLGEMNADQLWETTMNPAHRKLLRVGIEDAVEAERIVTILMGDKVEPRREYISAHANFNRADTFEAASR
ncbi:MAG: DNA topoisomerase subunit B [Christensenellales bacterium]|uniref:DNA topoisomerase (ATP-hydrolyzing) n=1 Tax=Candidatus Avichristensenella intestinipullorum TaxID=2840693 RepID=A0A9D0YWZ1_9FIRM|nr:DNA topoisomerase subunit B [Christensenellales bacterium]HIQ63264.1 type IIA DNA topoisomerase subunit B [Candidatus Avichristensenella intestinipullorum]